MSGVHESARAASVEWLTPPDLIERLGPFDTDPASPIIRPWDTAKVHYSRADNGLQKPWEGRVWLNPPWGKEAVPFIARMAEHRSGIMLLPARPETAYWRDHIWNRGATVAFLFGRVNFIPLGWTGDKHPRGRSQVGVSLIAYTEHDAGILWSAIEAQGLGKVVRTQ